MIPLTLLLTYSTFVPWIISYLSYQDVSITQSRACPSTVHVPQATHYINLFVHRAPLNHILIEIPDGVQVNGDVIVTTSITRAVDSKVSILPHRITIQFTQPIATATTLTIRLKGVQTGDRTGRTWLYRLYGNFQGNTALDFLGVARIQTYKHVH